MNLPINRASLSSFASLIPPIFSRLCCSSPCKNSIRVFEWICAMAALRRTLPLRSLFSARSYQPPCSGIIRHHEEKPNYSSLLHQRPFSSSTVVSRRHHLRGSSHLSLCNNAFGVIRSMSTSRVHKYSSLLQDVASQTTTLTRLVDAAQQLVDKFGFLIMQMLSILMRLYYYLATKYQGGDPAVIATSQREYDGLVNEYGRSTSAFSSAWDFIQPRLFPCVEKEASSCTTGGAFWLTDNTSLYALSFLPFETLVYFLIGLESLGIAALVGLRRLAKQYTAVHLPAGILARRLAIPVVLIGMVLSKVAHWYFKSCMFFSLASMYFLLWCALVRKHRLNANAVPTVPLP